MSFYGQTLDITSQQKPIVGREQDMSMNNAGGFSFAVDKWTQMNRFLILGTENPSYYATREKMTTDNAHNTIACIKKNGARVVQNILDISLAGRAAKQDATLYSLALCASYGDEKTKIAAYGAIPQVCRTGTMLFSFVDELTKMRGWSSGLRKAVAKFYTTKNDHKLDLQLVKYRQRNDWTHRDVLRLSHPKAETTSKNAFFAYAVGKGNAPEGSLCAVYETLKQLPQAELDVYAVKAIKESGLPREGLPTSCLKNPDVWMALLEKMPIGALVRNLGNISKAGLTASNTSPATERILQLLGDDTAISKSRVHPMNILIGMKTYQMGRGIRGSGTWQVNSRIVDALDKAYYKAFVNVPKTGKKIMHCFDVSASMGVQVGTGLSAYEAQIALALPSMAIEDNYESVCFSANSGKKGGLVIGEVNSSWGMQYANGISPIDITPRRRIADNMREVTKYSMGGTDCGLPIQYALQKQISVDVFVIYTDSQSWAGEKHVKTLLDEYRRKINPNAKLIAVGMQANKFSVADPKDSGMMDVCGFDTTVPAVISLFSQGF